jgi:hypothetical protein
MSHSSTKASQAASFILRTYSSSAMIKNFEQTNGYFISEFWQSTANITNMSLEGFICLYLLALKTFV